MNITTNDMTELRQHLGAIIAFCRGELRSLRGRRTENEARYDQLKSIMNSAKKCRPLTPSAVQAIEDAAEPLIGEARRVDADQRAATEAAFDEPSVGPTHPQKIVQAQPDPGGPYHGYGDPPEFGSFEHAMYCYESDAVDGMQEGLTSLAAMHFS